MLSATDSFACTGCVEVVKLKRDLVNKQCKSLYGSILKDTSPCCYHRCLCISLYGRAWRRREKVTSSEHQEM